jgi:hypothetical protein
MSPLLALPRRLRGPGSSLCCSSLLPTPIVARATLETPRHPFSPSGIGLEGLWRNVSRTSDILKYQGINNTPLCMEHTVNIKFAPERAACNGSAPAGGSPSTGLP